MFQIDVYEYNACRLYICITWFHGILSTKDMYYYFYIFLFVWVDKWIIKAAILDEIANINLVKCNKDQQDLSLSYQEQFTTQMF